MAHLLKKLIKSHKLNRELGIYSICSSNQFVLEAAIEKANQDNSILLIESTSNQVDQFGGYIGKTPQQFVEYVYALANRMNFPVDRLILGGDHLGPNVWQNENSDIAMKHATDQISAYVLAGYEKIHLDASMGCADDAIPLKPEIVAQRAALLCQAAEKAVLMTKTKKSPVYVIGTEVPIPGGAQGEFTEADVSKVPDVKMTIDLTKEAFYALDLQSAWENVIATVVEPGVEFGDETVSYYDREKTKALSEYIMQKENIVYEAHSTDYQKKEDLKKLVEDHFPILKVGPWLTFAFREAIFSLADIEKECLANKKKLVLSNIKNVIEEVMINNPKYWINHYSGDDETVTLSRKYSYSDRIRYYWTYSKIENALSILLNNLKKYNIPLSVLSQFMPTQYEEIIENNLLASPETLIQLKIAEIIDMYSYATQAKNNYDILCK